MAYRHVTTTDDRGEFSVPACSVGSVPVALILREEDLRALPPSWIERGLCPLVFDVAGEVAGVVAGLPARTDRDVLALELIDLHVQQPDGLPAELAHVDLLREVHGMAEVFQRKTLRTDRGGRLRFLRAGERLPIYARHGEATALIDIVAAERQQAVPAAVVRLRRRIELRGRLLTAAGTPASATGHLRVGIDRAPLAEASAAPWSDESLVVEVRDPGRIALLLSHAGVGATKGLSVASDGTFQTLLDDVDVDVVFSVADDLMQPGVELHRLRLREDATRNLRLVVRR